MDLEIPNLNRLFRGATLASTVAVAALFSCSYPTGLIAQAAKPVKRKAPIPFHLSQPEPINFDDHEGWTQIFDGKTLKNWDGDTDVWHVEDGAIVGESSPEHPSGTTNILWRGGEPANFRLKLEMKLEGNGANGGIQYRSFLVEPYGGPMPADLTPEQRERRLKQLELDKKHEKWALSGYQADYDFANHYTGQLYEQSSPRTIIAWPGQVVATEPGKKPTLLALLGTPDEMKSFIKPDEWNQVEIIADGNILTHIINGHVMAVVIDTDSKYSQAKGLIALEIEGSGNLKIRHRNIWLKKLP